ncbi:MAG: response regulator [Pirellulaceae bacterium]
MATVLIVDDSPLDRRLTSRMLEEVGLRVTSAEHGKEALEKMEHALPDMVLTDMQMPEMDGLQLVDEIGKQYPAIPVIVMTAFGSEETAVVALQKGAASYVPKQNLARDLVNTVKNVLAVARAKRETRAMMDSMTCLESQYVLSNTIEGLDALIGHVKEQLRQIRLFGERDILRVGTALYEALINAIEHGNLELDAAQRDSEGPYYRRFVEDRSRQAPFRSRHIYLTSCLTRSEAIFTVRDEGNGFDSTTLPDPTAPENVGKVNGRGLFLIRTFMDEVSFSDRGNEITMVKRRTLN